MVVQQIFSHELIPPEIMTELNGIKDEKYKHHDDYEKSIEFIFHLSVFSSRRALKVTSKEAPISAATASQRLE